MRVVVFGAIRSVHTPELHTRIPLALHTHAHACTRIRGLRRLSPIPRQDPTPLMRLSVPFPPPRHPRLPPAPFTLALQGRPCCMPWKYGEKKGEKVGVGAPTRVPFCCALHNLAISPFPALLGRVQQFQALRHLNPLSLEGFGLRMSEALRRFSRHSSVHQAASEEPCAFLSAISW